MIEAYQSGVHLQIVECREIKQIGEGPDVKPIVRLETKNVPIYKVTTL